MKIEYQNLLVAGTTGSGKSVLINQLVFDALRSDDPPRLALIDPKRVELDAYRKTPFCAYYGDTPETMADTLHAVIEAMEHRYEVMKDAGTKTYYGSPILLVIDELGDLMTTDKRAYLQDITHILQLGRAANIRTIAGTQSPNRVVLPAQLQVCFTEQICLRCRSAIESRQVIGQPGGEKLPKHGKGLFCDSDGIREIEIPMIDEAEMSNFLRNSYAKIIRAV